MSFDHSKKMALTKDDKSNIGGIDGPIQELCNTINAHEDYCTTSSCSGRITIMEKPKSGRKNLNRKLFVSHDPVSIGQLKEALVQLPDGEVWFTEEGAILHAAARNIDLALDFVNIAHEAGFKRAGIISSTDEKTVIEVIDTTRIELPIASEGRILLDDDYLKLLLTLSNQKLEQTHERIKKFEERIKKKG